MIFLNLIVCITTVYFSDKLLDSAINCVNLLDANEAILDHKQKLHADIIRMEKELEMRKAEMLEVNMKLRSVIPRIINSQKEIHSEKAQQMKFGNICEQVGRTIMGDTYK